MISSIIELMKKVLHKKRRKKKKMEENFTSGVRARQRALSWVQTIVRKKEGLREGGEGAWGHDRTECAVF